MNPVAVPARPTRGEREKRSCLPLSAGLRIKNTADDAQIHETSLPTSCYNQKYIYTLFISVNLYL